VGVKCKDIFGQIILQTPTPFRFQFHFDSHSLGLMS